MTTTDDRLQRLADAYGVEPTLDRIASAIVARTAISAGQNELGPVQAIVSFSVLRDDAWSALEDGEAWPPGLTAEIVGVVAAANPAMPPETLTGIARADLQAALRVRSS